MLLSFFSPSEYVTDIDYSDSPGCIAVFDIEFDHNTHIVSLNGNNEIVLSQKPIPPESRETKHSRIYQSLITTTTIEDFDLEGEIFSDFEIGELITARVFGGNPHAEKALTNKALTVALAILQGAEMTEEMAEKITEVNMKKAEVDEVRNLFNLDNL